MDWFMGRSKKKDSYSNLSTAAESSIFQVQEAALTSSLVHRGVMHALVDVPLGVDVDEWIATQTIMLFENINLLCGCLSDYCKPHLCPSMGGPDNIQYTWSDDRGKKTKMCASEYIDCVTSYIHSCVHNEQIFPTKYGNSFPSDFRLLIGNIQRLLCHILVHSYHSHLTHLTSLHLTAHYTTILYHFLAFNRAYPLANQSDLSLFEAVFAHLDKPTDAIVEPSGGVGDDGNDGVSKDVIEKSSSKNKEENDNGDNTLPCDLPNLSSKCDDLKNNKIQQKQQQNNTTPPNNTNIHTMNNNSNLKEIKISNSSNKIGKTNKKSNMQHSSKADNEDLNVTAYTPLFTIVT